MDSEKNKILEGFLIGLLLALIIVVGWYGVSVGLSMKKNTDDLLTVQTQKKINAPETVSEKPLLPPKSMEPFVDSEYVIKKGDVKWVSPKDIGDLGLTTKENYSGKVKYVKAGEVTQGNYAGSEIVVIVSRLSEGPQMSPDFMRILVQGNNSRFIFLGKHVNNYDEYFKSLIRDNFFVKKDQTFLSEKISIAELKYPTEFAGRNEREKFILDPYAIGFFTSEKLKPAFVDPQLGQIFMTDIAKAEGKEPTPFDLNSYVNAYDGKKYYDDIFGLSGFYLKLADGLAVAYKLKLDIFNEMNRFGKLLATWNDGKKNEVDYEENPSGCGGGSYIYEKTKEVNLDSDAVAIGKTEKGDTLYGYKDTTNAQLKKLYQDIYWVEEGKTKKDIAGYLKMNPIVFWVDPFGRTLAFYRGDMFSPAECGKPVIYLYPEKPMEVKVRVNPGNGLTFTEPKYDGGWNVFADTESHLRNLADGKTYPYLFWEGSGSVFYEMPKQGFVMAKNDLDAFFNEKLPQLGLNEKEKNDFKEFWLPKMLDLQKPYYFVTFLPKRYIDMLAPLLIEPKPETVIRVLMDYRGLDAPESVEPLSITTPERKGFTAVEWGGFLK